MRKARTVRLVKCRTDAKTMNSLVAAGGLTAEPADEPNLFYLRNSGREIESEIEADLLAVVGDKLDQAVRKGVIPPWTLVNTPR
jgi:hypothetical protein